MGIKFLLILISLLTLSSSFDFYRSNTVVNLLTERHTQFEDVIKQINYPKLQLLGDDDECKNREFYEGPDFFQFFPSLKGILKKENDSVSFWNGCFSSNKITLEKLTKEKTTIRITSSNARSRLCRDGYLISTSNFFKIGVKFLRGDSTYTLTNLTDDDITEITVNGIRFFSFCEDIAKTVASVYKTYKLFYQPGKLPFPINTEKEVIDFLTRFTDYKIKMRDPKYADVILDFDENLIQSGDFIPLYHPNGVSALIMYLVGSHVSHSTVAFRIDGELYILESEDVHGVVKTKFKEWVKAEKEKGYMIGWLPLKEEYRKKLNVEKALEWFKTVEGSAYGFHNVLFSWYDNAKRMVADYMDNELLLLILNFLEKIDKPFVANFFLPPLNMRLKTNHTSIYEITVEAAKQGLTFEELMAIPEKDEWVYENGENWVCSSLVIALYRAGGLFDGIQINAKEFTPRDIYQLDFIDIDFKDKRPDICKQADPNLPFCQLTGKYEMDFSTVSTVKPYSHMNERCQSIPPFYKRTEGC